MKRRLAALAAGVALWSCPLHATEWAAIAFESRLGFVATWEGIPFEGVFRDYRAHIEFDAARPEAGRFEISVQVASVDSDSAERDEGMGEAEWLDFAGHPTAQFVSSAIRATSDGGYQVDGTLTLKGISRPASVPFTWTADGEHARLRAETVLRRSDFAIGEGEWATDPSIGMEVRLRVDLGLRAD